MPVTVLALTFLLLLSTVTEAQISIETGPQPHIKAATDLVTAMITKHLIDEGYVVNNSFEGFVLRLSMIDANVKTIGQVGLVGHISLINNSLRTMTKSS